MLFFDTMFSNTTNFNCKYAKRNVIGREQESDWFSFQRHKFGVTAQNDSLTKCTPPVQISSLLLSWYVSKWMISLGNKYSFMTLSYYYPLCWNRFLLLVPMDIAVCAPGS